MKKMKLRSNTVFEVFLVLIFLVFVTIGIFLIFSICQTEEIAQIVQGSIFITSNLKNKSIVEVASNQNSKGTVELISNQNNKSIAAVNEPNNASISLEADKTKVEIGDNIKISVNTNQIAIAACTIHIYFDSNKLQVIDIPENANVIDNQIIYTWFDKRTEKIEQQILN